MRFSTSLAILCGSAIALSGCTLTRGVTAWTQSNASFSHCTSDPRILCEPGSETLANSVAPLLPQAIATVEQAQYSRFSAPVLVQTYATRESFSRYSGAPGYAEGAVSLGVLHLSPKLLSTPERTNSILTHEVSHLHLLLKLGSLDKGTIPAWFDEGLATFVSDGGGAETVLPASAIEALRHGRHFEPDASQWLLFPKNAASYGLAPHMFYRQSALFVAYMHDSNPAAFEQMLKLVANKVAFAEAVETAYQQRMPVIWNQFLAGINQ